MSLCGLEERTRCESIVSCLESWRKYLPSPGFKLLAPHYLSADQASDLTKASHFYWDTNLRMPVPQGPIAFTDAMADLLRLPDETLAMSYMYLNRYRRFQTASSSLDLLDEYVCLPSKTRRCLPLRPLEPPDNC